MYICCINSCQNLTSYLIRFLLQQALTATVRGAVLHLARVVLLEPRRHQTPPHRRQHAIIHCSSLSKSNKPESNKKRQSTSCRTPLHGTETNQQLIFNSSECRFHPWSVLENPILVFSLLRLPTRDRGALQDRGQDTEFESR